MSGINVTRVSRNIKVERPSRELVVRRKANTVQIYNGGPRGLQGVQGIQGEQGEQGPQGPAGDSGGGGVYFTYYTDGVQEGNTYTDFDDLMDAIADIDGRKYIQIFQSETIPDGSYNWDGVVWKGQSVPSSFGGIAITTNNVTLTSWNNGGLDEGCGLIHTGSQPLLLKTTGPDVFQMGLGTGMTATQEVIFKVDPAAVGFIVDVGDGCAIANTGSEVFEANGAVNFIILAGGASVTLTDDLIKGDTSAGQAIMVIANPASGINPNRVDNNFIPGIFSFFGASGTLINFDGSGVGMSAQTVAAGIIEAYLNGGGGGGSTDWGDIGGDINNQTDLIAELDALTDYIDSAVVGLLDDRGNYDASGNSYPSSGGSGPSGQIMKGDIWVVSNAGQLGGVDVAVGDQIRALVDNPGGDSNNWAISEANIGYVPENVANKSNDTTLADDSATDYTTEHVLKTVRDTLVTSIATKKTDSVTGNRLLGRFSGTTGVSQEIQLGTGFTIAGGTLSYTNSNANMTFLGTYSFASDTIVFYIGGSNQDIDVYTANRGDVLRVRTAGSKDFGLGTISLLVDDFLIYDGTNWRPIYNISRAAQQTWALAPIISNLTASRIVGTDGSKALTSIAVGSGLSLSAGTLSATGGGSGDVVGPASSTNNDLAQFDGTTGKLLKDGGVSLDTDGTAAANSNSRVMTQAAIVTYVASMVAGLLDFKGATNASANPNYPAASKGDTYVVSAAGKIGGASGKSVDVGDMYIATADNAGGTEASVGTSWTVLEHNLIGSLLASNNLSELTSPSTARTNLGLVIGTDVSAPNPLATDTLWDTKGDLVAATGANTAAKVPASTDGYVLQSDSGAAAGVSYRPEYAKPFKLAVNDYLLLTQGIGTGYTAASPSSSAANSNNQARYVPFFISDPVTIGALALYIQALNGGASAVLRLGIYYDNDGRPGNVHTDAGSVSINTTGVKTLSFSNVTLAPGRYWAVAVLQNLDTAGANPAWAEVAASGGSGGVGETAPAASNNMFPYISSTGISGSLANNPTVISQRSTQPKCPHIWMQRTV